MSSSIDKTLNRVHERIRNREFYEAHQAVRTIVARHLRKRDYALAIGLLYSSSLLLAKSHQTGSASDLLLYMIEVYKKGEIAPSGPSRGRIAEITWHLDCRDAVIKQIAQRALGWSPQDTDLAHVFGTVFVRSGQVLESEKYLLQGNRDSAELLGRVHAAWAKQETDANTRALFLSRGVLGFLSAGNIRNALVYLDAFESASSDLAAGPVAEFTRLLITTCQTKDPQLYKRLSDHYKPQSTVPAWNPALQIIEQDYFGIVPQRGFNIMDMMGGMLK